MIVAGGPMTTGGESAGVDGFAGPDPQSAARSTDCSTETATDLGGPLGQPVLLLVARLAAAEVRRAQVESFEGGHILRAERSEFIEQLFERFAAAFFSLSETVEGERIQR